MFEGVRPRFSLLLPILRVDDAVRAVVNAIEMNNPKVLMPFMGRTMPAMRLLPIPVFDCVAEFFAVTRAMDAFTQRHKSQHLGTAAPEA